MRDIHFAFFKGHSGFQRALLRNFQYLPVEFDYVLNNAVRSIRKLVV